MTKKTKKAAQHLLYAIISNVLYGLAVYYLYVLLIGYSPIYVYSANLALILLFLALDNAALKAWESKKMVLLIQKEKDLEKSYRTIQLYFDSFISFKTILYLFYIVIMIAAQTIDFFPAFISGDFKNFILANSYSVLLLIAFDQLIGQFSKDRQRIKGISEKLKRDVFENAE